MPYPVIDQPDVYRITLPWERDSNDVMLNILHFDLPPGSSVSNAQDAADAIRNGLDTTFALTAGADYLAMLSDGVKLFSVHAENLGAPTYAQADSTFDSPWVGGGGSFALPGQNAVVVTLNTGLARRRGRGRIYTGGYTTSIIDGVGALQPGQRDHIATFWKDCYDEWLIQGMRLGVLSRGWIRDSSCQPGETHGKCRPDFDQGFIAILDPSGVVVRDTKIDTQRSRAGSV